MYRQLFLSSVLVSSLALTACGGDSSSSNGNGETLPETRELTLNFKAIAGQMDANCDNMITGLGPDGTDSVGLRDLRFYVSNIRLYDDAGAELDVEFDSNEFQYNSDQGFVALIDFTSNDSGSCDANEGEGTARTNLMITGDVEDSRIADIAFDVGLSQAVMKDVIATNTAEDAPSPLNEMYWSWASGYRHFVFNFEVMDAMGTYGGGALHIGSRGCGGDGQLALENKEECDFINTPSVMLQGFDPDMNTITVDLAAALNDLAFAIPQQESEQTTPGVNCHSSPMQTDCASIFVNFGVDMESGVADANGNTVFGME
ncbi:hypothetical protein TDB9533_03441 [Thalassocella blandensis]|nr:hypothetical protein TDB9533_03441 [Thalassocella blandensis]